MKIKILLTALLLFISNSMSYSIDFELEEITLPYDNLEITHISVKDKSIICRAGDKLYKSEDDGLNWEIIFDSSKRINDYFELESETIFIAGDSGMVYRSVDFGSTWVDISIDTDTNISHIAAKDINDYLVVADSKNIYHTTNSGGEWTPYYNKSGRYTYDLTYFGDRYLFGGESSIAEVEYKNTSVYHHIATYINNFKDLKWGYNGYARYEYNQHETKDKYRPFKKYINLNDELFIASNNELSANYFNKGSHFFSANDTIVHAFVSGVNLSIFDESGNYYEMNYDDYLTLKTNDKLDYSEQSIGIDKVNFVIKTLSVSCRCFFESIMITMFKLSISKQAITCLNFYKCTNY